MDRMHREIVFYNEIGSFNNRDDSAINIILGLLEQSSTARFYKNISSFKLIYSIFFKVPRCHVQT